MRGPTKKRGVADRSLSFKSGRSESRIGPNSQLRGQFAGRRHPAITVVAPTAGGSMYGATPENAQQLLAGSALHTGNTSWKNR
jgi:hypothetical protein